MLSSLKDRFSQSLVIRHPARASFLAILLIVVISFLSNLAMSKHLGQTISLVRLWDISFYYWTPAITSIFLIHLVSWIFRIERMKQDPLKVITLIVIGGLMLSPVFRMVDILLDFSIKNILGMTTANPFNVLNTVWWVVVSSAPQAFFRFLVILFFFTSNHYLFQSSDGFVIKHTGGESMVAMKDIILVKSNRNYVEIHTKESALKIRKTLKQFQQSLNHDFLRVHRSCIVNQLHIRNLKHWRNGEYLISLSNGFHVSSSQSFKSSIESFRNSSLLG